MLTKKTKESLIHRKSIANFARDLRLQNRGSQIHRNICEEWTRRRMCDYFATDRVPRNLRGTSKTAYLQLICYRLYLSQNASASRGILVRRKSCEEFATDLILRRSFCEELLFFAIPSLSSISEGLAMVSSLAKDVFSCSVHSSSAKGLVAG